MQGVHIIIANVNAHSKVKDLPRTWRKCSAMTLTTMPCDSDENVPLEACELGKNREGITLLTI